MLARFHSFGDAIGFHFVEFIAAGVHIIHVGAEPVVSADIFYQPGRGEVLSRDEYRAVNGVDLAHLTAVFRFVCSAGDVG